MPQAVTSTLFLYAEIHYQHEDVVQMEKRLNENFENLFADLLITN